jgi:hypothetical protein
MRRSALLVVLLFPPVASGCSGGGDGPADLTVTGRDGEVRGRAVHPAAAAPASWQG